ncbi:Teneurin-a [Orchesella cincta]|uniref:Teneurin-a n=1 Tax=Orchesella cincta TaxID=48709 RepID=A0A1D2N9U2_ORCCI|nr:Teneurin-a [Orchesella cincta]
MGESLNTHYKHSSLFPSHFVHRLGINLKKTAAQNEKGLAGGGVLGPPSNPVLTGIPSAPVILPVFPNSTPHPGQPTGNGATNSRSLTRNQYSPSRFTIQKDCHVSDRCSWKCISIALILLCITLISILIYFAGKSAQLI